MVEEPAPGLCADWLNGWLAAVGVTVLLPDVLLSWSQEPVPCAAFRHAGDRPLAERIAETLPNEDALRRSVLAQLGRKVDLDSFHAAAEQSRARCDPTAALSVSDLGSGKRFKPHDLPHGGFDPGAPQGTTLATRVIKCRGLLGQNPVQRIGDTLEGAAVRENANGLGFDIRRISSGVQPGADKVVDPAIECLCFAALEIFPVRGNGHQVLQRGWSKEAWRRGAFVWPVWADPLDRWSIDALLDCFYADPRQCGRASIGIHGVFADVPYRGTGSSDPTRGYGSERLVW